jgi:hypothetical protein
MGKVNLNKYGKKYENTRKEWLGKKNLGLKIKKEFIGDKEDNNFVWNKRQNNFQEFNSRFTFFPLYDTDNNSFIRLYRLHGDYKKVKKNGPISESFNILERNIFRECIIKMNEQLVEELITNPEPLFIDKDVIECYKSMGEKKITQRYLPLRLLWTIHNPFPYNSDEKIIFPKIQQFTGRLTYKQIKKRANNLKQKVDFFFKFPSCEETYSKKKYYSKEKIIFKDIKDNKLSYNMFDDF